MNIIKQMKLKLGLSAALLFCGATYAGAQEAEKLQSGNNESSDKDKLTLTINTTKSAEISAHYGLNDLVGATISDKGKLTFWNDAMFDAGASIKSKHGTSAEVDALILGYTDETGKTTFATSTFMLKLKQEFKGWNLVMQAGQSNAGAGVVFPKSGDLWGDARNYRFYGPNNKCTLMLEKNGMALEVGMMARVDDGRVAFFFPKNANPFIRAGFAKAFNESGGKIDFNVSYQGGKAKLLIATARVQDNKKGAKAMGIYSEAVGLKVMGGLWTTINDNLLMLDLAHINKEHLTQVAITYDIGNGDLQLLSIANFGKDASGKKQTTCEFGISKKFKVWGKKTTKGFKNLAQKRKAAVITQY